MTVSGGGLLKGYWKYVKGTDDTFYKRNKCYILQIKTKYNKNATLFVNIFLKLLMCK